MNREYRTEPTIEAGISIDAAEGNVRFLEYQPGNGTRYTLLISKIPAMACRTLGVSEGTVKVDLEYGGKILVSPESFFTPSYASEKLGCTLADAEVLIELLTHFKYMG
jgi:hypothetical protein